MRSTPSLRTWFPQRWLCRKQFQCSPDWRWPSLVLSRKIVERFLFPCLTPMVRCPWFCQCPQVVAQTPQQLIQIFREASHLWNNNNNNNNNNKTKTTTKTDWAVELSMREPYSGCVFCSSVGCPLLSVTVTVVVTARAVLSNLDFSLLRWWWRGT